MGPPPKRRPRGRPKKRRANDLRRIYDQPSALARAADHACLTLFARSELDETVLVQADQYAQRTVHWGGAQSTMLVQNVPPPMLPPPRRPDESIGEWVANLERWAVAHTRTRTLKSQDRCFKVRDALYRPARDDAVGRKRTGEAETGAEIEGAACGTDDWVQCVICGRWHIVTPTQGPISRLPVDFRCGDATWGTQRECLPKAGGFAPEAWAVIERWMRDLSLRRYRLTFDQTIGFGLVATDEFRKGELVTHGLVDFDTAEPGYQTERRKKDGKVGTTRGPSAIVNWACADCSNVTFKNGYTGTQAKRTIRPGDPITACYSTDDELTCFGPNCDGVVRYTRQKRADMDQLGQKRADAQALERVSNKAARLGEGDRF